MFLYQLHNAGHNHNIFKKGGKVKILSNHVTYQNCMHEKLKRLNSGKSRYHSVQNFCSAICCQLKTMRLQHTRSVNKVMRLIQYNSVLTFKLQIEFVPFKIVPLGCYTPPETLFPLFVAMLVVANRNRF